MKTCLVLFIIGLSWSAQVESKWDHRENNGFEENDWFYEKERELDLTYRKDREPDWNKKGQPESSSKADREHFIQSKDTENKFPNKDSKERQWFDKKERKEDSFNRKYIKHDFPKANERNWENRKDEHQDRSDRKFRDRDWEERNDRQHDFTARNYNYQHLASRNGQHKDHEEMEWPNRKEGWKKDKREMTNHISSAPKYSQDPPDHKELIPMARYVIHNADWASIATISTLPAIVGFPFSNVKSMVDGYIANSTGIPYFYMSPLDFTARDLKRNTRATVLATLEETKFCALKQYDPEDPRCTRVMLSGKMKKVPVNSTEFEFAKGSLFERHPSMANFPADHDFFVAKLKIAQIAMVDWFGGAKYIPVRDYLAYNYTEMDVAKKIKKYPEIPIELPHIP